MPKVIKQSRNATVLTPRKYERKRRTLPKSWVEAAGMLKGKLPDDSVAWQRKIRSESEERLERQVKLAKRRDDR